MPSDRFLRTSALLYACAAAAMLLGPGSALAQTTLRWMEQAGSPPATAFRIFKGPTADGTGELVLETLPVPSGDVYAADVQIDEIDQGLPVYVWLTAVNAYGESPASNANFYPEGCDPGLDSDCDGIPNDGAPGEVPCVTGQTQGCDDNCPYWPNPGQKDVGGVEVGGFSVPPDGIGNVCQCGDVSGDGRVNLLDAVLYENFLGNPPLPLPRPERCNVVGRAACELVDLVVLRLALQTVPSDTIRPRCESALSP